MTTVPAMKSIDLGMRAGPLVPKMKCEMRAADAKARANEKISAHGHALLSSLNGQDQPSEPVINLHRCTVHCGVEAWNRSEFFYQESSARRP